MDVSDFNFDLPDELIAQAPLAERSASRLLVMDRKSGALQDRRFAELDELLEPGDLLVFNDTRVVPARLYAEKDSGGRVEILIERVLEDGRALAQLGANRKPRPGMRLTELETGAAITVESREDAFWRLRLDTASGDWSALMDAAGHMPLPPYIQRADSIRDRERYQTVYARAPGAVAAPTAGLHFDDALFERLQARGVRRAFCTLHVGAGTFQPVRVERVEDHRMHPEWLCVDETLVEAVRATRAAGRRVVAVGTTAMRALETAARAGASPDALTPFVGDSRLFIYPGFEFRVVDALVTNFHLPGSTLVMLVAAFSSRDHILSAYRHAVAERYRFFSYGDAMLMM
ncbi:MAG: tRNA preQ1(34) S-adenosylmethionine ribosyltransferase-isomerase QueA [Wenzhouxiangellaceae bacterium]|nr:tRNA preQ1(34) S-adenosylmethionine ribosyltransferase-isomerase QueA [Wenzhouxiangellaceae bacterium]